MTEPNNPPGTAPTDLLPPDAPPRVPALQQRLRAETAHFDFATLLNGVSPTQTETRSPQAPPYPAAADGRSPDLRYGDTDALPAGSSPLETPVGSPAPVSSAAAPPAINRLSPPLRSAPPEEAGAGVTRAPSRPSRSPYRHLAAARAASRPGAWREH